VTYNFRFDPVIYATDEIKGDECNPVFNYSKTHCIDNFDAFILQSFQTEMVTFRLCAYPDTTSAAYRSGKLGGSTTATATPCCTLF